MSERHWTENDTCITITQVIFMSKDESGMQFKNDEGSNMKEEGEDLNEMWYKGTRWIQRSERRRIWV